MRGLALQDGHFLLEVADGLSPGNLMPSGAAQLAEQLLILVAQPLHVSHQLPPCLHATSRWMIARFWICIGQHVVYAQLYEPYTEDVTALHCGSAPSCLALLN